MQPVRGRVGFFFFLCISNRKLKVFDANSVVFRAQNKIHALPTDKLSASYSSGCTVHAYLVRQLRYWFINIFYIIISTFGLSSPVLLMLNPFHSRLIFSECLFLRAIKYNQMLFKFENKFNVFMASPQFLSQSYKFAPFFCLISRKIPIMNILTDTMTYQHWYAFDKKTNKTEVPI